tara:strand:+ start:322 stop:513 length:192 start_codon:yes stop_codon:yes gene_type:complete
MINKIWNWIKNKFKSEKQDPHLVLYEDMPEPDVPVHVEEPKKCGTHNRYKKSCPTCREIAGVA